MSIVEKFRSSQSERRQLQAEETATSLYQIKEYNGEIWLTFNQNLVCPCSMLNEDPVEAIKVMRELYIKRSNTCV